MRHVLRGLLGLALGLTCATGLALAADAPPIAGTWKATFSPPGQEITIWLVKIVEKDGKPDVSIVATGLQQFQGTKVENVRLVGDALHMDFQSPPIIFGFVVHIPKEEMPKTLLGSVKFPGGSRELARLERTDLKTLEQKDAVVTNPDGRDLMQALRSRDQKKKETGLKEFLDKHAEGPLAYHAAKELLPLLANRAAAEADIRTQAEQIVKIAGPYGPEIKGQALQQVAQQLESFNRLPALALDYARQAEKSLDKSASPAEQVAVLKTLAAALRKAGKTDEAKDVGARVATIDAALDQEFIQHAIPFKPAPAEPRKGDRIVVFELFTGAQCPPCVAADVAFDALLQTYKSADVVMLQYHLHIPGPDPLTNADSEKRSGYYAIQGTPTLFIDGKEGPQSGGAKSGAKQAYDALVTEVNKGLEKAPQAQLRLTAKRVGENKIKVHADVSDLKKPGEGVRLHLVLVEEMVRYPGRNGQRLHHHVVRSFIGGVEGQELKEASAKQDVEIDLAELTKSLGTYLDDAAKKRPFLDGERPLDLKDLKVVAFIQDHDSKEVHQAAQADLHEAK